MEEDETKTEDPGEIEMEDPGRRKRRTAASWTPSRERKRRRGATSGTRGRRSS